MALAFVRVFPVVEAGARGGGINDAVLTIAARGFVGLPPFNKEAPSKVDATDCVNILAMFC